MFLTPEQNSKIFTADVLAVCAALESADYEVRAVGGCVRDVLMGNEPKDVDLATTATPEQMIQAFDAVDMRWEPTGLQHGTVSAIVNGVAYEVTTLRADVETDGRHAQVEFITNWKEDAARRDLTINAMSVDSDGKIFDYFGGQIDIQEKMIRFVGNPVERIQEDYLRIMRAIRFAVRFDFNVQNDDWRAIRNHSAGLQQISGERLWQEFSKILECTRPRELYSNLVLLGWWSLFKLGNDKAWYVALDLPVYAKLAYLTCGLEALEYQRSLFKFDNAVYEGAKVLLTFEQEFLDPESMDLTTLLISGTVNTEHLKVWLRMKSSSDMVDRVELFESMTLPITGRDILALGVGPGPEVGQKLKKAKTAWVESGYKLSSQELLENLV